MLKFNKGKFGIAKRSVTTSATSIKKNVQVLIEMGLDTYLDSGNTVYLTTAMAHCIGVKALPNRQLQAYIERAANVEWTKSNSKKNGTITRFIKVKEGGEATEALVDVKFVDETTWYDFAPELNADAPHTDVDKFLIQLKTMLTRGKKAIIEDRVDGDTDAFNALVTKIGELV